MSKKFISKHQCNIVIFLTFIFGIVVFVFPIYIPFKALSQEGIPLDKETNPEAINGILTVSAIIAAFSTFSTFQNKRRPIRQWVILFPLFAGQMIVLMVVGTRYFMDYVVHGYATINTMAWAASSLLNNLLILLLYRMIRIVWGEE